MEDVKSNKSEQVRRTTVLLQSKDKLRIMHICSPTNDKIIQINGKRLVLNNLWCIQPKKSHKGQFAHTNGRAWPWEQKW